MAFHESLWVAVAAAAPVISLANQLTLIESLGMLNTFTKAATRGGLPSDLRDAAKAGRWSALILYLVGFGNLAAQAVALAIALRSLGVRRDFSSYVLPGVLLTVGIVAIAVTSIETARIRDKRDQLGLPDRRSTRGKSSHGQGRKPSSS